MIRVIQIACVAVFIAVMVAVHQGAKSVANYMGGDFALGVVAGCAFCALLYFIIQKLEAGKASRSSHPAAQQERPRDFLDL